MSRFASRHLLLTGCALAVLTLSAAAQPAASPPDFSATGWLNENTFHGGDTSFTRPVVNGVATFNLTIDQGAGGYALTASGNGEITVTNGTASNPLRVYIIPGTPSGLTAQSGSTITLNWTAPASGATQYSVYRSTTPGGAEGSQGHRESLW